MIIVLEFKHTTVHVNTNFVILVTYSGEYDTKMYNRNISITVPPHKKNN